MRYHVLVPAGKTLQKMRKYRTGWHIEDLQTVAKEQLRRLAKAQPGAAAM